MEYLKSGLLLEMADIQIFHLISGLGFNYHVLKHKACRRLSRTVFSTNMVQLGRTWRGLLEIIY